MAATKKDNPFAVYSYRFTLMKIYVSRFAMKG